MIHWVWVAWPFNMKIQPYNYQKQKRYNYQKNKQHLKLKEMECQYRKYLMVNMEFTPCLQICQSIWLASILHVVFTKQ